MADRLSLIHFYGCGYENIAFEKQQQEEKELAFLKREMKRAEKIGKEKQKRDQRKRVSENLAKYKRISNLTDFNVLCV